MHLTSRCLVGRTYAKALFSAFKYELSINCARGVNKDLRSLNQTGLNLNSEFSMYGRVTFLSGKACERWRHHEVSFAFLSGSRKTSFLIISRFTWQIRFFYPDFIMLFYPDSDSNRKFSVPWLKTDKKRKIRIKKRFCHVMLNIWTSPIWSKQQSKLYFFFQTFDFKDYYTDTIHLLHSSYTSLRLND